LLDIAAPSGALTAVMNFAVGKILYYNETVFKLLLRLKSKRAAFIITNRCKI
jgi:hypothetical protein